MIAKDGAAAQTAGDATPTATASSDTGLVIALIVASALIVLVLLALCYLMRPDAVTKAQHMVGVESDNPLRGHVDMRSATPKAATSSRIGHPELSPDAPARASYSRSSRGSCIAAQT